MVKTAERRVSDGEKRRSSYKLVREPVETCRRARSHPQHSQPQHDRESHREARGQIAHFLEKSQEEHRLTTAYNRELQTVG